MQTKSGQQNQTGLDSAPILEKLFDVEYNMHEAIKKVKFLRLRTMSFKRE
jgi:hypothetical protein